MGWIRRPTVRRVTVQLPGLEQAQCSRAEKALKFLFNDCGCLWGAPVFLAVFLAGFLPRLNAAGFSWIAFGGWFLGAAIPAIAAKFVGLAWSYRKLKVWFRKLDASPESSATGTQETIEQT